MREQSIIIRPALIPAFFAILPLFFPPISFTLLNTPKPSLTYPSQRNQALRCTWHQVNNYRVLCSWLHTENAGMEQASEQRQTWHIYPYLAMTTVRALNTLFPWWSPSILLRLALPPSSHSHSPFSLFLSFVSPALLRLSLCPWSPSLSFISIPCTAFLRVYPLWHSNGIHRPTCYTASLLLDYTFMLLILSQCVSVYVCMCMSVCVCGWSREILFRIENLSHNTRSNNCGITPSL